MTLWRIFLLLGLSFCVCAPNLTQAQTNPQNAALLAFKREQIDLLKEQIERYSRYLPADLNKALIQTQNRAALIEKAVGDAADTPFNLHERSYFAPDGSPQPYWVALPDGYSARKKWPLIVYLHGYSSDISKINPWFPPQEMIQAATKRGFVMAIPYGRRNSDFVQWGQDDVLQVRQEAIARYSIDSSRVFLAGASMGGYGVYAVALHDPGQWTAVAAICGRTDFYVWFKIKRDETPVWQRALYDADDPRFLIRNAQNLPFFIQHGTRDLTVSVEHSRLFASDAKILNLPVQYLEDPDGDHWSSFQIEAVERAFEWFRAVPASLPSRKTAIVAVDLREAKSGWARIEAFETYGESATLSAQIGDSGIAVTTKNVTRFVLEPPRRFLRGGRLLALTVDGVESPKLYDPLAPIVWQAEGAKTLKSPARCGPFKNALRDPFLLVYGDKNDQKAAERMAQEWKVSADGIALLKDAAQVSDEDKAKYNLILFGTRATNPLLAQIADDLPLELTQDGYRSGQKVVAGKDLGLRMVWKSPWSEKRLIGVCSGVWWGEKLPVNHKWDLIPDYLLYNETIEKDDTNRALEAGFFDGNFQLPTQQ